MCVCVRLCGCRRLIGSVSVFMSSPSTPAPAHRRRLSGQASTLKVSMGVWNVRGGFAACG